MAESQRRSSSSDYSADRPLSDPKDDEFDRAAFAAGVARAIAALPPGECFVIGIHGPWGDGKTTVLNFIESGLGTKLKCVRYNPWRFVGEDALLFGFFRTLASAADLELKTWYEQFASIVATGASVGAIASEPSGKVADLATKWGSPTLEQARDRLVAGLREATTRLIVFIDDIDRLEAREVAVLFRLIKASADLPNVVYVLAFDRDQVAATLGEHLTVGGLDGGRKFLEKIVQIPLMLPPATQPALERACLKRVHELLQRHEIRWDAAQADRWENAFRRGVGIRLRTPRHLQQYLNALNFAVPMLMGEVNVGDLLLVEALRTFYPGAYELIRRRQRDFLVWNHAHLLRRLAGQKGTDLLRVEKEHLDEESANALTSIVEFLFPRVCAQRSEFIADPFNEQEWTAQQRVCAPAYTARYFSYAIGAEDVADSTIATILAEAEVEGTRLQSLLRSQASALTQDALISKLEQAIGRLGPHAAERLAVALATLSDELPVPYSLRQQRHAGIRAARVAAELCQGLSDEEVRRNAMIRVLQAAATMWFAAAFMRIIDPHRISALGLPREEPDAHLKAVRKEFLVLVEKFLPRGQPILDPAELWKFEMVFSWARAAGRDVTHEHFVPPMSHNRGFADRLLHCLAIRGGAAGAAEPNPRNVDEDALDRLNQIVDVDAMHKLLNESWVRDEHRESAMPRQLDFEGQLLAEFVAAYRRWLVIREFRATISPPTAESS